MPWFNVDDSAHSHPKIIKAGNAAFGLWTRCGSYVAQHLTDGIVPGAIAEMYGTAPQIKKLVAVGLWHPSGHACADCPQPADGDFYMHDYFKNGNPRRAEVLAKRARAAEKKRRQRAGAAEPEPPNPGANRQRFEDDSRSNRGRFEDESETIHTPDFDDFAGQDDASRGDSRETRARAFHSTPLHSKEQVADVGERGTGSGARAEQRPEGRHLAQAPIDDADFRLTDTMRRWVAATYPALDVDYVTAQFISHYRATGGRRQSWPDAWQKWVRSEAKHAAERAHRAAGPTQGAFLVPLPGGQQPTTPRRPAAGTDARFAEHLDLIARLEAGEAQ